MKSEIKFVLLVTALFAAFSAASEAASVKDFLFALEQVESSGNANAYNKSEKALGCLQIRPIMVADYNRIYKANIRHSQMKNRELSHKIAIGIFKHYSKNISQPNAKHLAFIWNGGGSAWRRVNNPKQDVKQKNLEKYWQKVFKNLTI